jgi:hypothetical protein
MDTIAEDEEEDRTMSYLNKKDRPMGLLQPVVPIVEKEE